MTDTLKGFDRPTAEEFRELWNSGTFFVDTNVLLNLYRYPKNARSDLLAVLQRLGDRLFAPFHVILEFERNRLNVIADQTKKFRDVESILANTVGKLAPQLGALQLKKRHSLIDPESFLTNIDGLVTEFKESLAELEKTQAKVHEPDEIREAIRSSIKQIGDPPSSQEALDEIYKVGEKRYRRAMPPGYKDESKLNESDEYEYGGLVYRRSFGDLIMWEQMIEICKTRHIEAVALVSDDVKEDWWLTVNSAGSRKIGPRPELVEEISRRGGVKIFWLYNSEQLVQWSGEHLEMSVNKQSIAQIREVREASDEQPAYEPNKKEIHGAVFTWIAQRVEGPIESHEFFDFVARKKDGRSVAYKIVWSAIRSNELSAFRLRILEVDDPFDEYWVILIVPRPDESAKRFARERLRGLQNVGFIFANVDLLAGHPSLIVQEMSAPIDYRAV